MDDNRFGELVVFKLIQYDLFYKGWRYVIVDELNGLYGYTDFDERTITFSREHWPTSDRNIKELILHEVAHVLVGHGEHTLDWWDKLHEIGGTGIWVENEDRIKSIGVTIIYK